MGPLMWGLLWYRLGMPLPAGANNDRAKTR